ncbi:RNA-directed DNA polymerase, eukaryota [Tanacetum coccineum]
MEDRWVWDLNGDGIFRVKDVRFQLDDALLPKSVSPTRWVKTIPIKINIFAWKVSLNRLPTRINLVRRGVMVSPISCSICLAGLEDLDHLLFGCNMAIEVSHALFFEIGFRRSEHNPWDNITCVPISKCELSALNSASNVSLLYAVELGKGAIPTAAAVNWVSKQNYTILIFCDTELVFYAQNAGLVFGEYLLSGLVPSVKEVNDEEPGLFPCSTTPYSKASKQKNRVLSPEAKEAAATIEQRDIERCMYTARHAQVDVKNVGLNSLGISDDCGPGGMLQISLEYVEREFNHAKRDGELAGWIRDSLLVVALGSNKGRNKGREKNARERRVVGVGVSGGVKANHWFARFVVGCSGREHYLKTESRPLQPSLANSAV